MQCNGTQPNAWCRQIDSHANFRLYPVVSKGKAPSQAASKQGGTETAYSEYQNLRQLLPQSCLDLFGYGFRRVPDQYATGALSLLGMPSFLGSLTLVLHWLAVQHTHKLTARTCSGKAPQHMHDTICELSMMCTHTSAHWGPHRHSAHS